MVRSTEMVVEAGNVSERMLFRIGGWFRIVGTELEVTDKGAAAFRCLPGGRRRAMLSLPWDQVRELHYAPAMAGARRGLYAREGEWCSRCLVPGLDEGQADAMIAAIRIKFPHLAPAEVGGTVEAVIAPTAVRSGWRSFWHHRQAARAAH